MNLFQAAARGFGLDVRSAAPDPFPGWFTPPETDELIGGSAGTMERAVGLPALLGVVLRCGQGVGMMPVKVYAKASDGGRSEAQDERGWELLHDRPSAEATPQAFHGDIAVSLAGHGKAVVRKIKSRTGRGVLELIVEDPRQWKPRRSAGRLVFDRVSDRGHSTPLDQRDIVWMRGIALNGSVEPLSPITAHRLGLTSVGLLRQRFERSHYEKGARPGTLLVGPEDMSSAELEEWVDAWDRAHAGIENAGQTAAIAGGFTATTLPVNFADAQFVEANQWTAAQVGAVYGMPKAFLNLGDDAPSDADWRFWVTFGLGWITGARDQAFTADPDIFPLGLERGVYAETVTEAILKPDVRTRYEAYKAARQAGWMTSNEIRKLENLPPHPDGDVLQVIPVGGGEPSNQAQAAALEELLENAATSGLHHAQVIARVLERVERRVEASDRTGDALAHVLDTHRELVGAIRAQSEDRPVLEERPRQLQLVIDDQALQALRPDPAPVSVPVQVDVHVPEPPRAGRRTVTFEDGRSATIEDE